jgi:predicted nucleic acid-binding protein
VPSIAVDAGPLLALFDGSDKYHADAVAFIRGAGSSLVTNLVVLAEAVALLPPRFQLDLLGWTERGGVEVDWATVTDFPRIVAIMTKYADLPADFADASLVALCERRGIREVATLDNDFNVYRTADRKRLHNVFFAG